MKSLTIRGIPDNLLADLKNLAKLKKRSLNSQIIVCLSDSVSESKTSDQILQDVRKLKSSIDFKGFELSPEELKATIKDGRA